MNVKIIQYTRIGLALVLLFSGVLKGFDPIGLSGKITEYLNVFNILDGKTHSILLAILICSIEIFAGVMLALNIFKRFVAVLSVLIFAGFSFIIGYVYLSPGVAITQCSCFGDLIEIPIGYTFLKNILFALVALIYLYFVAKIPSSKYGKNTKKIIVYAVCLSFIVPLYSYVFLPPIEFTSYNVGNSIKNNKDFKIYNKAYKDITDSLLSAEKPNYVIVAKEEFTPRNRRRTIKLINSHNRGEINLIALTSNDINIENSVTLNGIMFSNTYIADPLLLKTILRAPKGVVVVDNRKIVGKYGINSYLLLPFEKGSTVFVLERIKVAALFLLIAAFSLHLFFINKRNILDLKE